ncbi:MAG TPA: S8 family peptidase [Pyrinomonadaceae bacterium]|jgi:hypothetical protein|nr:S8 family peptidase [Pyrinomonadaceae bacterium]
MTIIKNEVSYAAELPADYKRRVVIKFKPGVKLPYSAEAAGEFAKQSASEWNSLTSAFEGVTLAPYFSTLDESSLRGLMQRPSHLKTPASTPDLTLYYAIECPGSVDPEKVAKMAAEWPNVEIAYAEPLPAPLPSVDPSDDPRSPLQGYLNAAPAGIDARWAWNNGIDGSGAGFVDLERGWMLDHEDLAAKNITIISGISKDDDFWHGTAVLGVVVAVDNTIGGVGIAPACDTRVVSEWRTSSIYSTAEAILSAAMTMSFGDILLLETSTLYSAPAGLINVPVEVYPVNLAVIQMAVSKGIVVVEAGGNGSVDLDAFQDINNKHILNRNSADFLDSGAIIVGAASSAVPHARLWFSNFGSRIDCYAWGENIDTAGGPLITDTHAYTPDFNGTSGATSIVTGAALLLQSWRALIGASRYDPDTMRVLLSDPVQNTASKDPAADRIGVMPDLKRIIQNQQSWWFNLPYRFLWVWFIIIGGLIIFINGKWWCIKCGSTIFDPAAPVINVLGVILIAAGVIGAGIGIVRAINARR